MFWPSVSIDLLCLLLTSGALSLRLSTKVAHGGTPDLPGYCAFTFTLMSVTSTSTPSVQVLDFEDVGLLIRRRRLYVLPVRRTSALPAASFRFCLTTDTLAVRLMIPPAGFIGDFPPDTHQSGRSLLSDCAMPGAPTLQADSEKNWPVFFDTRM
jgi:hypothetical protein